MRMMEQLHLIAAALTCCARILGQQIHKIVGYSSYGALLHSCSFSIHAASRRAAWSMWLSFGVKFLWALCVLLYPQEKRKKAKKSKNSCVFCEFQPFKFTLYVQFCEVCPDCLQSSQSQRSPAYCLVVVQGLWWKPVVKQRNPAKPAINQRLVHTITQKELLLSWRARRKCSALQQQDMSRCPFARSCWRSWHRSSSSALPQPFTLQVSEGQCWDTGMHFGGKRKVKSGKIWPSQVK